MSSDTPGIAVWDWAVRLFHWLIVLLIPLMWWTAEEGMMDWHRRFGLTLVGLLIFRITWGILGSWTARFAPMMKRLRAVPDNVRELARRQHKPAFGHGPLGVLSVFALLISLTVQVSTGLFSVDVDGLESGPLAMFISFDTGRQLADIHELNFDILVVLIALHIAAILTYRFAFKDKLIGPMVSGSRPASDLPGQTKAEIRVRPVRFVIGMTIAATCTYAIINAG